MTTAPSRRKKPVGTCGGSRAERMSTVKDEVRKLAEQLPTVLPGAR